MSSPRSRRLAIAAAALAAALALALFYSCSKKEETPPPPVTQAPAAPAKTEGAPAPAPAAEAPATAAPARGNASITGQVTLTGAPPEMQPLKRGVDPVCAKKAMNDEQVLAKDGKLENVVVWVSEGAAPSPAPARPAKLEQLDCMYRPRVQAVQDGQTLSVHNADATLHNVRAVREGKTLFNKAQTPNGQDIAQSIQGGPVLQFKCDVHPWMKAFAVVVPNELSSVTGPDGKFSISGLADGKYTVSAWHELYGTKTAPVTIESGKATPILFSFNTQDRQ